MNKKSRFKKQIFISLLIMATLVAGCGGSGGDSGSASFQVTSISPAQGKSGVTLDKEIRVVFSHVLDINQPDDAIMVHDSAGQPIPGKTIVNQHTLIFSPSRYPRNGTLAVTISPHVRSRGLTLQQPFKSSFKTGDQLVGGKLPPPAAYNPLGLAGDQISLVKIPEVAIVWSGNSENHFVVEDPPYNPTPMTNAASDSATALTNAEGYSSLGWQKIPVSGQFDDDKWDETAIFSHDGSGTEPIRLTIIDTIGNNDYIENGLALSFGIADSIAVDSADFNADGRDEILIATSSKTRPTIDYYLIAYDPASDSFQIATQGSITPSVADTIVNVRVAAGDVDADGKAEAVFTWDQDTGVVVAYNQVKYTNGHSSFAVLDDLTAGMVELSPQSQVSSALKLSVYAPQDSVDVTTGDIDGDGADEVLIGLTQYNDSGTTGSNSGDPDYRYCGVKDTLFLAQNTHAGALSNALELRISNTYTDEVAWNEWLGGDRTFYKRQGLMPVLKTADLDGNGSQELMFHNILTNFVENKDVKSTSELKTTFIRPIPETQISTAYSYDGVASRAQDLSVGYLTIDVQVGDIDGDLKEDFVLLRRANRPDGTKTLDYLGNQLPNGLWVEHSTFVDCVENATESYCAGFDKNNPDIRLSWKKFSLQGSSSLYWWIDGTPRLTLPNVDGDSIIVEKADHTVYTSDNSIVAVLAAPPCSEEIGQDVGNCATEFGQGTTNSWEKGSYLETNAGILWGFEIEPKVTIPVLGIKLTIAKVEVEGAFGAEFSWQHKWGYQANDLVTYSAGADNNLVVFDSYVYDRFRYQILSHPEVDLIGTYMNVSIPTGRRRYAVGQEYYNVTNGSQIDIGPATLAVVPGDLTTYPNRNEADAIVVSGSNGLVAISNGYSQTPEGFSNAVSVESGVSETQGNDFTVGGYATFSAKACGPDADGWTPSICGGLEGSISSGYATSNSWGKDLVFAGTVTGIPSDRYAQENFGLGIFAYTTKVTDVNSGEIQQFNVVNYFIDK